MIVLQCCRCGSTDLILENEDEVFCKGCNGSMDIDLECQLLEVVNESKGLLNGISISNLCENLCEPNPLQGLVKKANTDYIKKVLE